MPLRTTEEDDEDAAKAPSSPVRHDSSSPFARNTRNPNDDDKDKSSPPQRGEDNSLDYYTYYGGDDDQAFARRLQEQWKEKRLRLSIDDDDDMMEGRLERRQQQEQSDEELANNLQNEELAKRYQTFAGGGDQKKKAAKTDEKTSKKPPQPVTPYKSDSSAVSMMMSTRPKPVPGTLRYSQIGKKRVSPTSTSGPLTRRRTVDGRSPVRATLQNVDDDQRTFDGGASARATLQNVEDADADGTNTGIGRMTWRSQQQQELAAPSYVSGDQTAITDMTSLPGAIRVGDTNESAMGTVQIGSTAETSGNCHHRASDEREHSAHDVVEEEGEEWRSAIGEGGGVIAAPGTLTSLPLLEAEVATEPILAESVRRDLRYGRSISSDSIAVRQRNKNRRNRILGATFIILSLLILSVVLGVNFWNKNEAPKQPDVVVIRFEKMTVVIQLDGKPEETGWSLSCGDSFEESEIGFAPGIYEGRAFELIVHTDDLIYEEECTFTIVDTGGDGIDGGYFEIYEGEDISNPEAQVIRGSGFTDSMSVSFSLDSPMPSLSPTEVASENPSNCPSDSPSQVPTQEPTSHPTDDPSMFPTQPPSMEPSSTPSTSPSSIPSTSPSLAPSSTPSTAASMAPSSAPSQVPTDPPSLSPTPCPVIPQGAEFQVTQSITLLRRDGQCLMEQDLIVLEDGVAEGYNTQQQSLFDACSPNYRRIVSSVADRDVLMRCVERQLAQDNKCNVTDISSHAEASRRLPASPVEVPFGIRIRCTPDALQCTSEDFANTKDAIIAFLESTGIYIILGFDYDVTSSPTQPPTQFPTLLPTTPPTQFPTLLPTTPPTPFPTLPPTPPPTTPPPTLPPTPPPTTPPPTFPPTPPPTTPPPTFPPTPPPTTPPPTLPPTPPPTPDPTPRPTPDPTPRPTPSPTPPPTPDPTPRPTPQPTDCGECDWGDWSDWSDCSAPCDGIKTRTRVCECDCCEGENIDTDECNEANSFCDGTVRFYRDDPHAWLHATSSGNVQGDDSGSSYWRCCGDHLVEHATNLCLEYDNGDVRLATCQDGAEGQEWRIESVGDYIQIENREEDCCLEIQGDFDVDCEDCSSSNDDQIWCFSDTPVCNQYEDTPDPTPSPTPEPAPTNCHDYPSSYCGGSTWCSDLSGCGEGTTCVECYGDGHCDWEAGEICDCDPNSSSGMGDGVCKKAKTGRRLKYHHQNRPRGA